MDESETINSRAYWDRRFSVDWDERGGPDQSRFFASIMLEWLSPGLRREVHEQGWSICDWGCAEGDGTAVLASAFPSSRVSGVDLAPAAIAKASERYPAISFRPNDAENLADASDVVVTSNVLEHLDDPWGTLAKLAPLARHAIVMLVPFLDTSGEPEHVHIFRPLDIRESIDGELYLAEARVIDTSRMPQSRWPGLQLLAVYRRYPGAAEDSAIRAAATEIATLHKIQLAIDHGGLGPSESWPPAWRALNTARMAERNWDLSARNHELDQQNRELTERIRGLVDRNKELTARTRDLGEQSATQTRRRQELERELGARDRRLAVLQDEVARLSAVASDREGRLRELEALIHALYGSTSWRITRPLRGVVRLARGDLFRRGAPSPSPAPQPQAQQPARNTPADAPTPAPAPDQATAPFVPAVPVTAEEASPVPPVVAMLLHDFDVGGVERFIVDMSRRLGRLGVPCAVFATGRIGRLAEEAGLAGIPVHACPDATTVGRMAKDLGIRLVVAHHCTVGWENLHSAGIPIIEVLHNLYHWQRGDDALQALRGRVSRFVAVSQGVREFAIQHLGLAPDNVLHLANGVDPSVFLRPRREAMRALRRQPEFVFVQPAQIWAAKCHHTALTAFEKLHREFPHTRLVFAGAVGDADVHERLVSRIEAVGLEGAVDIVGNLDRRGLSHQYARANAMLLPSLLEGFSIATLEALYFGLPMILTDIGGAREVIEDEDVGILVPPPCAPSELTPEKVRLHGASDDAGHAEAVLAAMRRMVEDRQAWEAKGLDGMVKFPTFDMDVVAARYEAILAPLLSSAACGATH